MLNWDLKFILILFWTFLSGAVQINSHYSNRFGKPFQDSALNIPYYPLAGSQDLDRLIKEIGNARVVLLGESTHGTHEFYTWRAEISKRLIQEKGFDFLAVEGDWVDSYKVNQFIKGPLQDTTAIIDLLQQYDRWPTSIWSNYEMVPFISWLNEYNNRYHNNQSNQLYQKLSYYGLDLYSFWEWTNEQLVLNVSR